MLTVVMIGIALCGLAAVAVYADARAHERRVRAWQLLARKLRLRFEGDQQERTIEGRRGGVPLRAHYERKTQIIGKTVTSQERITLTAGGDGEIPRSLSLRQEPGLLGRLLSRPDPSIGDADFDALVELTQLDEYVCAALSQRARELSVELLRRGGEAHEGVLRLEDLHGSDADDGWLEQQLQLLAELGAELSVLPSTLHRRLAQNASGDPHAGVRLANLRYLAHPRIMAPRSLLLDTARVLLADPDVPVRSLAAQQLGAEGFPVLFAIAGDRSLEAAPRVAALEALGQADAPDLEALLAELLSKPDAPELLIAVLTGVGTLGLVSLRGAVVRCTALSHEAVRAAATRALAQLVDTPAVRVSTEQRLLQLLDDPSDDVQQASADALSVVGSVRAVEPLLGRTQGLGRSALRQAARSAIASIQSRLGNVEAGRISLAETALLEGAVDLADTSATARVGEVSLANEESSEVGSAASRTPRTFT